MENISQILSSTTKAANNVPTENHLAASQSPVQYQIASRSSTSSAVDFNSVLQWE